MKRNLVVLLIILLTMIASISQTAQKDDSAEEIKKINLEVVKLFKESKFNEAFPLAKKSAELAEKKYGSGSTELATAFGNLGYILSSMGEVKSAENHFEKAIKIYKKIPNLGQSEKENFVKVLESLAISKQKREFIEAESELEEAASWREKVSGADAKELISTNFLLANINYWKKNYKKSAEKYYKVLDLIEKHRTVNKEEAKMAYYRCRCSYIKAMKSDELDALEQKFENNINSVITSELVGQKGTVLNGKALNLVKPPYPQAAKDVRATGTVNVEVLIGKTGKVLSACGKNKVHESLIEAAEVAAYNSTFSPTTMDGIPLNVTGVIVYNFSAR
jgi:predicted nucleic-acid-binding protein